MRRQSLICAVSLVGGLLLAPPLHAGIGSKLLTKGIKEASKTALEKAVKESLEQFSKSGSRRVQNKFGSEAVGKLDAVAKRLGKEPAELHDLALRHPETYGRLLRTSDAAALDMVARNGEAGRFLVDRFYGQSFLKPGSKWFHPDADDAVQEAFQIADPRSVTGSWKALRTKMTRGGLNGPERDLPEELFLNRARNGINSRIPNSSKYFDGHSGGKRQGLDMVEVDKDGRLSIIEFSTGKKPSPENPRQMTDGWIQEKWLEYIADPNTKVNLRAAGINPRLLDKKFVESPDFEVSEHFGKKFACPEIDPVRCRELGAEWVELY